MSPISSSINKAYRNLHKAHKNFPDATSIKENDYRCPPSFPDRILNVLRILYNNTFAKLLSARTISTFVSKAEYMENNRYLLCNANKSMRFIAASSLNELPTDKKNNTDRLLILPMKEGWKNNVSRSYNPLHQDAFKAAKGEQRGVIDFLNNSSNQKTAQTSSAMIFETKNNQQADTALATQYNTDGLILFNMIHNSTGYSFIDTDADIHNNTIALFDAAIVHAQQNNKNNIQIDIPMPTYEECKSTFATQSTQTDYNNYILTLISSFDHCQRAYKQMNNIDIKVNFIVAKTKSSPDNDNTNEAINYTNNYYRNNRTNVTKATQNFFTTQQARLSSRKVAVHNPTQPRLPKQPASFRPVPFGVDPFGVDPFGVDPFGPPKPVPSAPAEDPELSRPEPSAPPEEPEPSALEKPVAKTHNYASLNNKNDILAYLQENKNNGETINLSNDNNLLTLQYGDLSNLSGKNVAISMQPYTNMGRTNTNNIKYETSLHSNGKTIPITYYLNQDANSNNVTLYSKDIDDVSNDELRIKMLVFCYSDAFSNINSTTKDDEEKNIFYMSVPVKDAFYSASFILAMNELQTETGFDDNIKLVLQETKDDQKKLADISDFLNVSRKSFSNIGKTGYTTSVQQKQQQQANSVFSSTDTNATQTPAQSYVQPSATDHATATSTLGSADLTADSAPATLASTPVTTTTATTNISNFLQKNENNNTQGIFVADNTTVHYGDINHFIQQDTNGYLLKIVEVDDINTAIENNIAEHNDFFSFEKDKNTIRCKICFNNVAGEARVYVSKDDMKIMGDYGKIYYNAATQISEERHPTPITIYCNVPKNEQSGEYSANFISNIATEAARKFDKDMDVNLKLVIPNTDGNTNKLDTLSKTLQRYYCTPEAHEDTPFKNYTRSQFLVAPKRMPQGLITGKYNNITHSINSSHLYSDANYINNIYANAKVVSDHPAGDNNVSQYFTFLTNKNGVMGHVQELITGDPTIANRLAISIAGNDGQPAGGLFGRYKSKNSDDAEKYLTMNKAEFSKGGGQEEAVLRECFFNIIKDEDIISRIKDNRATDEDRQLIEKIYDDIFTVDMQPAHGLFTGKADDYRTTQQIDYVHTTNPQDFGTSRILNNMPLGTKKDSPTATFIINSSACSYEEIPGRQKRATGSMSRTQNQEGYDNAEFRHETIAVAIRAFFDTCIAEGKTVAEVSQIGTNIYAPSKEAKEVLKPNGQLKNGEFANIVDNVLQEQVGPNGEQRWQYLESIYITDIPPRPQRARR